MGSGQTVAFHTLGCKLNFAESSTIARTLREHGYSKVNFEDHADVYVINTCSVTENADRECRAVVRKAMKNNPSGFIAVIGCYAQLKPQEIASIEGVDLVLGATEKFNLPFFLSQPEKKNKAEIHSCEADAADLFVSSYSSGDRTRAFLKVQDGCDYSCTYCTIPLARGKSRSDTVAGVIDKANEIAAQGIKEIVLTGVNTGDFYSNGENFLSLIKALDKVQDIERFRISSIEPNLLTDDIIHFVSASRKFVPHFHIPLQSGSDNILRMMKRRYRKALYADRINKIKSLMPDCCIGADVIVGFPGEDENEFLETYHFLTGLDVSYLHVFTYSERDNTEAASLENIVPIAVRKKRNSMLRILSQKKLHHFYQQHLGSTQEVMFETENRNGMLHGFTENYIRVKTPFDLDLVRQIAKVQLQQIDDDMEVICSVADLITA